MNIAAKIATFKNAHRNTSSIQYGQRLLILADLASDLGLKLWIGETTFDLAHPRRKQYLVSLPQ